jgi:prepilin-type N-terminal cleavage/methylation domain-containing protein
MMRLQKGFTLIEIIAALAIIGLGLVGILSLFPVGIDASKRAGDLTNATVLGQSVLTQIRAGAKSGELSLSEAKSAFASSGGVFKDFDQPPSNKIIPVEAQYIPKVTADGKERTLYEYQVSFEDVPKETKLDDLSRVGLQKVTVTISWPATESDIEYRNRATLVTFIRFPTPR